MIVILYWYNKLPFELANDNHPLKCNIISLIKTTICYLKIMIIFMLKYICPGEKQKHCTKEFFLNFFEWKQEQMRQGLKYYLIL